MEVRLRIAEYALAHDEGLFWHWESYTPDKMIGRFRKRRFLFPDHNHFNPLGLACRQLHRETEYIPFKVNTLHFDVMEMGGDSFDDYSEAPIEYLRTAIKALRHFVSHASTAIIVATRIVHINCFRVSEEQLLLFSKVVKETPHMKIDLCPCWWANSDGKRTRDIDQFMDDGRCYETILSKLNFSHAGRSWRVRTGSMDRAAIDRLRKHLSPDDFTTALRWIEEGL